MAGERSQALLHITRVQRYQLVAGETSTNSSVDTRLGAMPLNADGYPNTSTFVLRVLAQVDNGQTYVIRLYDLTGGAYVTGSITDTNAGLEEKTLSFTPGAGSRIYELHAKLTSGADAGDYVYVPGAYIEVTP